MASPSRLILRCPCGTTLAVPSSAIGKKTQCTKCARVLVIKSPKTNAPLMQPSGLDRPNVPGQAAPKPKPISPPKPAPRFFSEHDSGYQVPMAGLVDESAEPPPLPAASKLCPNCGAAMTPDAVFCVSCGYDMRAGEVRKTKRKRKSKLGKAARTAGRFMLGVALSSVGSLVGTVVWCVVVFMTGYEIGWIAWGVGFLAGVGMKLGYGEEDDLAGIVAGGIALLGILLAKGVIFAIVNAAGQPAITFGELFGLWDALFFFLAAATAYKIGNGSYGSD